MGTGYADPVVYDGMGFFISVLQTFVLERRQILWFWGMTILFLAFVQLFFTIDMFPAVLRCTGVSLLLQGLLQQGRWYDWRLERPPMVPLKPGA